MQRTFAVVYLFAVGQANSCTPTRVGEELGRIVEVGATHYNHISAALTQESRCYMWGQCRGQSGGRNIRWAPSLAHATIIIILKIPDRS